MGLKRGIRVVPRRRCTMTWLLSALFQRPELIGRARMPRSKRPRMNSIIWSRGRGHCVTRWIRRHPCRIRSHYLDAHSFRRWLQKKLPSITRHVYHFSCNYSCHYACGTFGAFGTRFFGAGTVPPAAIMAASFSRRIFLRFAHQAQNSPVP